MSLNCNISASNGSSCSNLKLKKTGESSCSWRALFFVALLLLIAIGVVCFLVILRDGDLLRKSELQEEKNHIFLPNVNVSNEQFHVLASLFFETDQITSLTCRKESGSATTHEFSINCALSTRWSSNSIIEKQYKHIYVPIQDEGIPINHHPSLVKDKSGSFIPVSTSSPVSSDHLHCAENVVPRRVLEENGRDHCGGIYFCFILLRWWILFALAISCNIAVLSRKFWNNPKKKLVNLQPLGENSQILQQLQIQQAQISSRSAGKWRKKLLVIFVLSGVIGSMWLFWYMNSDISLRRKDVLSSMCDERARMLQDQFNVSMNHVHALAILVSAFHHEKHPSAIDQKTFEEYTERTAFERPLTSGVAYALRVPHSAREQFEKVHGWTIKKMETEDQTLAQDSAPENLDCSPFQDEYAPVIFCQKTVSHIVSIDMMSGKEDRENILRARASGKGVLTSPFKLLKSNHLGVVLTFAVYNNTHLPPNPTPQQRINATMGYIGASYDVPSLVEKLLQQLASKQTIVVSVYDTTNGSAPIKMYGTNETDTGLLHISHLDFGDPARKHEMRCRFKQIPPPWTAIMASVGVLVITLLLGHIFRAAINQIAKVESGYREMMELKHRAEAADIAKSQFLATVSHEIRTPMNGVLGMLQMVMDTNLDATQMDYAQTALASGRDLISLINEVLDQAKIESGRLDLEAAPFDLRDVLDNVVSLFSSKSYEKGMELAVYVSKKVPDVVIGDRGRFRQIITNLVGNSIKFTDDKGHIFVSVHLAEEVKDLVDVTDEVLTRCIPLESEQSNALCNTFSGYPVVDRWRSWEKFRSLSGEEDDDDDDGKIKLLITVEDTGVGIPLEAQDRIFQPFMQADSSTSRTYGGTGIGLSISKRLIDLMGGEIGFVSKLGIGSTFSFTAILTKPDTTSLDIKQQPYNAAISDFFGLRALVVDEKSIRAEVTRYHLQRLGMHVDIASNMTSAYSCISSVSETSESQPFSLVFIDKDNWDKETHTFHTLLKENISYLGMPPKIILCAASINSTERDELKSTGLVDNVLMKPLRLSVLLSCFQEATGSGKKRQVSMEKPPTPLRNLLRGKQILVVDDNAVNRRVAEGALKKFGAIVTCVVSGKAAKEMLTPPHKLDACFMDLQMPEMDGFEATRQIRNLERKYNEKVDCGEIISSSMNVGDWHTPILAMTADVIQASNEECMKCGMDDYVSKPFEEGQLYSAVARFFQSQSRSEDLD